MQEQYIKLSDLIKVKGIGEKTIQRVKETLFSPTEDKKNTYINKPKLNITIEPNNIYHGDCIEVMKCIPDNYVDSIVTDPPYELGFMGKSWDSTGIAYNVEMWKECLRILKPGGHLLSFGGTKTYHRMACAIEDAGFEIRDQLQWLYSQGFPKGQNISKAIDKKVGAKRKVIGKSARNDRILPSGVGGTHGTLHEKYASTGREKIKLNITIPATEEAKKWEGWNTCLKPAHEPIVLARKPLSEKTIVDNVLKWGTGAINVDGCRIGVKKRTFIGQGIRPGGGNYVGDNWKGDDRAPKTVYGRFPANVILDEEAGRLLDEQSGVSKSVKSMRGIGYSDSDIYGKGDKNFDTERGYADKGGASRFFYCAKASKRERGEGNKHPTVKPQKLMRYLCRLVTPPNGIVLDPFMGSGTTALACIEEDKQYIGIELDKEYIEIANRRIEECKKDVD